MITIIVFHWEDLAYLRGTIRQLKRYAHPDIPQQIIIADQSKRQKTVDAVFAEFTMPGIRVVHLPQYGSGYSVDHIFRHKMVTTKYTCTIDVDAFPIHRNWLKVPIALIEYGFTWVGVHAQIEHHYGYNKGQFFDMCQHFRVGRSETYDQLAYFAGFCKNDSRHVLGYYDKEWKGWSDDGVVAHWWEDQYRSHDKFTFAVSHHLGTAPTQGLYGRYTDDLLWHFGYSWTGRMVQNIRANMGDDFINWMRRLRKEGLTDALIDEMLAKKVPLEAPIPRLLWTKKQICTPSDELNKLVDNIKNS